MSEQGTVVETAEPLASEYAADEKQLRLLMKDWRQGRATRNLRQALSDAYVMVFALVMVGAMVANVLIRAQQTAGECDTLACTSARGLLPWAALFGVLGGALALCRMFGPVLASAAEGFWLMDAPIERARLLRGRLTLALGLALAAGGVLGGLVAALTGSPGLDVVAWVVATALGAAGIVAFAAAEQGAERTLPVRLLQGLAWLAAMATMLAVVATATGRLHLDISASRTAQLAGLVGALGTVLLLAGGLLARTRLNAIRRARLLSGGSLAAGMQGAMFALDFGLMRDILVEREAMARGSVRPTRGRGHGTTALVWRDLQRLVRFPRPLLLLLASVLVPYSVQALGLGTLNVAISALVLLAALIPLFGSLRVLSRTKGLARCLPMSTSEIRTAATIVPSVLALLWWIAVTPAFMGVGTEVRRSFAQGSMVALACTAAGLVGAVRWVSAKPADYSSPMVSTSAGALPPGLAMNLVRGFDMVALITLPVVFGLSPWFSLVIAAVAFSILRMGGMDPEALQAQREEQQRLLEEARGGKKPAGAPQKRPAQQAGAKQSPGGQAKGSQPQGKKVVQRKGGATRAPRKK
ncbi:hypothetical protein GCM10009599_13290 [Luteococcus peritonei]